MKTVPLGEVVAFTNGGTPSRSNPEFWEGSIPWITGADITDAGAVVARSFISDAAVAKSSTQVLPGGTVLLLTRTSVGKVAVLPEPMAINQDITGITPSSDVDSRYLVHFLRSSKPKLLENLRGATIKGVARDDVATLQLALPPRPEQRRIAAILDHADAVRVKRRKVLAYLDSLTQSIFHSTFETTAWSVEKLGDRLEFLTSGSRGWAKHYAPSGDKFIRIQNVKNGYLNLADMAFVAAPQTAEARRTMVRGGDVLLSITADLGRTAVVPADVGVAYINQHLAILRAPTLVPRYLADFLESPAGQREVLGKDRGATKAGLNFEDVRSVSIPVPPTELQHAYAARVSRIHTQRDVVRRALAGDEELFASLQSRAFRGEL